MRTTTNERRWDLVVVGSGPAGATIVHETHRLAPHLSILVLEAGRGMSAHAGEHLVEADEGALRTAFESLMRRARQVEYVRHAGAALGDDAWSPEGAGVYPASFLGHDFSEFSGASIAWNVGGMGIHWAAACPTPHGEEIPHFARFTFTDDLATARRLLRVTSAAYTGNPFQQPIIDALRTVLPSPVAEREAQNMPLAGAVRPGGGAFARSGPRDIAPKLFGGSVPHVRLRTGTLATRLEHRHGSVSAVAVRDLATGAESEIAANTVVVAADALRTPQLLWASHIRPEALGLHLNEHVSIDGDVVVDGRRLGVDASEPPQHQPGEPFLGAYWSPSIGRDRPTHGQMMERIDAGGHRIGMSWYTRTDIRRENRIEFSAARSDQLGLPVMTARFAYTEADLERIEMLRGIQRLAANALGTFTSEQSDMLAPGSSLHYTGTVRQGSTDDGTSVAGPTGRVWGYDNLYVAGNGAVPTALTCNSTLAAVALAVSTARAVAAYTSHAYRE